MPFKSEAQRRFMYANHPKLAREFESKTSKDSKLPEKVGKSIRESIDDVVKANIANILRSAVDIEIEKAKKRSKTDRGSLNNWENQKEDAEDEHPKTMPKPDTPTAETKPKENDK